ncbi:uncharacterized protein LOC122084384 [Macadamia integrifolia]|uniref:uncharacterized protein LOC122084384 n=1 Tax=Macadamia integrifolia TaxID=60698 RepID=UPI001C4EBFC1|nr:uncharacterized protein LOC122084384 [Macadamia integrifolia]XP_042508537.1 uncharacterized protein LOC122084384 [Macadamia integrifolia]XP_042508538.1 uncharacterized protein LOC122084384 [Macadamia integrifolia]
MKLEDFFTLTEIKDGLTALARVEELVSIMQEEKDSVLKNVREAGRQWSTVASTLTATESKDCLDRFVQLDGLRFLDRWLQEVHKCSDEMNDSFAEESVTSLLAAIEKLPKDKERLISSGISVTLKDLFGHKNTRIQDRARALFEGWNQVRDEDADHQDIEKGGACLEAEVTASAKGTAESGCPEQSDTVSPLIGSGDEDKHLIEPSGGEFQHSQNSIGSHSRSVEDAKFHVSANQHTSLIPSNQVDQDGFRVYALEGQSSAEESSLHPAEKTACTGTCSSPVMLKVNTEGKSSDILDLKDTTEDGKERVGEKGSQDISGREESESDSVSTSLGPKCILSTANHLQSVTEPTAEETLVSEVKGVSVDDGLVKHSGSTEDFKTTGQGDECLSNSLQDLPSDRHTLRKAESLETSFCRIEDVREVSNVKYLAGESSSKVCRREEMAIPADVPKLKRDTKTSGKIEKRESEMELEYGMDDALELARQVAKEVEREVVDNREPFCSSSSEKNSEGGVIQPDSPDSINDEQDQLMTGPLHNVPTERNLSSVASSPKEDENLTSSKDVDTKPEKRMQDVESSQVTEAAQEPAGNSGRSPYGFDLNEDVCSEEMASPPTPNSAPIAVATTKAAAATTIPAAPLHFEGTLGWKGSAVTSAFRPPAPRKTPDGEKTLSVEGSSHSSKYRQDVLDIDLNVDGADDDAVTDLALAKHNPESSSLPSGESSVEVSSRRAERLKLDLNRSGDNEDAPLSDSRTEGQFHHHHRNGHRSPSPASSSSSRQPLVRNIDLNDSSYFFDDTYDQRRLGKSPCEDMNGHGGFKVDDRFISIMGKRVDVNLKDCIPQTCSFIPNGQIGESLMETGMTRSGGGVMASPAIAQTASPSRLFGYSGMTAGSSISVTPAVYGPGDIPYMVDSRGAPVLLQIMGSPATDPSSYARGSFYTSMTSMPSGLNGVGPSQSGFDLNSGVMMVEGSESRESGGLRELFVQGQGGSVEEQMRSASLALNSRVGIRRREPEGGLESYPVGYKRQAPWN